VARRLLAAVLALLAAWVVACLVLFTWSPWAGSAPAHADAVVVLSGEHSRLPPALALIRRSVAPVLALSSVRETPKWRAARALCAAGRYAGARVLCFEAVPYSTRGEARTVAGIARRRGWRSIVVVTSRFHVTRAHMLFRRCWHGGLTFVAAPTTWWRLPADWADETVKLAVQLTFERGC
jgi:uncharacterized SAM-binding protein YcdF (DUF218 family)